MPSKSTDFFLLFSDFCSGSIFFEVIEADTEGNGSVRWRKYSSLMTDKVETNL